MPFTEKETRWMILFLYFVVAVAVSLAAYAIREDGVITLEMAGKGFHWEQAGWKR